MKNSAWHCDVVRRHAINFVVAIVTSSPAVSVRQEMRLLKRGQSTTEYSADSVLSYEFQDCPPSLFPTRHDVVQLILQRTCQTNFHSMITSQN
jgi:hypothetical protein